MDLRLDKRNCVSIMILGIENITLRTGNKDIFNSRRKKQLGHKIIDDRKLHSGVIASASLCTWTGNSERLPSGAKRLINEDPSAWGASLLIFSSEFFPNFIKSNIVPNQGPWNFYLSLAIPPFLPQISSERLISMTSDPEICLRALFACKLAHVDHALQRCRRTRQQRVGA